MTVDRLAPYLKAHLRSGDAVVLSQWTIDTVASQVQGTGVRYDINRTASESGTLSVATDSVVLYETNRVARGAIAGMTIVTGASIALTGYCAANPKACFGSCPTFYVQHGDGWRLEAEGFSSSVAPSLEATDVDALPGARPRRGMVRLSLRNEAFETHNIRSARLLAVPHVAGERVYAGEHGEFWRSRTTAAPARCEGEGGSCLDAVGSPGGAERFTATDSTDLAAREFVELEFPAVRGQRIGLVIKARHALVSTFLFYQALSYMGRSAGTWLAALERGDPATKQQARDPAAALGGIEVQQRDSAGVWITVAESAEHGPIASDLRVLPLRSAPRGPVQLRLRLARGAWRIDYLAVASLDEQVAPIRLDPVQVTRAGHDDPEARARLIDSARFLTTLPGDAYVLSYRVPSGDAPVALFLEARGYYLEWMREAWLAEENPLKAALMLTNPAQAMRDLAPAFKRVEPTMEAAFWRSRYVPR